ncbi:hypothetical protein PGTUg99_018016 [Puccinia graminis f. sp. tritici]|uniref:RRM domain-containing protein n=1 Tax=Puccinia graminis f. sp. tritici TaxID=56615 RepID=A0A5B0QGQ1_PUCGR|nr:hypothetical protein PGTUg99_018016 [Puccinia graminis f. sp. tritici]
MTVIIQQGGVYGHRYIGVLVATSYITYLEAIRPMTLIKRSIRSFGIELLSHNMNLFALQTVIPTNTTDHRAKQTTDDFAHHQLGGEVRFPFGEDEELGDYITGIGDLNDAFDGPSVQPQSTNLSTDHNPDHPDVTKPSNEQADQPPKPSLESHKQDLNMRLRRFEPVPPSNHFSLISPFLDHLPHQPSFGFIDLIELLINFDHSIIPIVTIHLIPSLPITDPFDHTTDSQVILQHLSFVTSQSSDATNSTTMEDSLRLVASFSRQETYEEGTATVIEQLQAWDVRFQLSSLSTGFLSLESINDLCNHSIVPSSSAPPNLLRGPVRWKRNRPTRLFKAADPLEGSEAVDDDDYDEQGEGEGDKGGEYECWVLDGHDLSTLAVKALPRLDQGELEQVSLSYHGIWACTLDQHGKVCASPLVRSIIESRLTTSLDYLPLLLRVPSRVRRRLLGGLRETMSSPPIIPSFATSASSSPIYIRRGFDFDPYLASSFSLSEGVPPDPPSPKLLRSLGEHVAQPLNFLFSDDKYNWPDLTKNIAYLRFIDTKPIFSLAHHSSVPLRTLIIENLPLHLQNDEALFEYFNDLLRFKVESVNVVRDVSGLVPLLSRRTKALINLEEAWAKWLGNPVRGEAALNYHPEEELARIVYHPRDDQTPNTDLTSSSNHNTSPRSPANPQDPTPFPVQPTLPHPSLKQLSTLPRPTFRPYWFSRKKVRLIDHLTAEFQQADDLVRRRRKGKFRCHSIGFVTFKSFMDAQTLCQVNHWPKPGQAIISLAPEPRDIYWPNLTIPRWSLKVRNAIALLSIAALYGFWATPVTFLANWMSYDTLVSLLSPKLIQWIEKSPTIKALIQNSLPTLAIIIFNALLPLLLDFSTVSLLGDLRDNPAQFIDKIASSLPGARDFFISYLMLQSLAIIPLQLLQLPGQLSRFFYRLFSGLHTPRRHSELKNMHLEVLSLGTIYPQALLVFTISSSDWNWFMVDIHNSPVYLRKEDEDDGLGEEDRIESTLRPSPSHRTKFLSASRLRKSSVTQSQTNLNVKRYNHKDETLFIPGETEFTDNNEPPMLTVYWGILDTGTNRYAHPAISGRMPLPQLPVIRGLASNKANDAQPGKKQFELPQHRVPSDDPKRSSAQSLRTLGKFSRRRQASEHSGENGGLQRRRSESRKRTTMLKTLRPVPVRLNKTASRAKTANESTLPLVQSTL